MIQQMRNPETSSEKFLREQKEAETYSLKTHKADGNDIKRLEDKLDALTKLVEGLQDKAKATD